MTEATLPRYKEFRVVGLTFVPTYPHNLLSAATLVVERQAQEGWSALEGNQDPPGLPVALVRNPDNEYDANAVEVHLPVLGRGRTMIGHVPAPLAARLAPKMDAGTEVVGWLTEVLVSEDHPEKPGALVVITTQPQDAA